MDCCSVCCEKYNKINHKKVICPFCDFESCKTCIQTYLLSTSEDPHCMSCKHVHNREFIDTFCTKRFRNVEYKKHRENVLFEREQAKLPETQRHARRVIRMRELRALYDRLSTNYLDMRRKYINNSMGCYASHYLNCMDTIRKMMNLVKDESVKLYSMDYSLDDKVKFTQSCPGSDCRGFLDETWVCGVCAKEFCEKCHEELGLSHTCDPSTVKTVSLLKRDTKNCPSCSTPITKIDGCAQMWCTQCQTAFDWRTGIIETGRIHNPHYFEFKSRTRENGDIPCGGIPNYVELRNANATSDIYSLYNIISTMEVELIYRYAIPPEDNLHMRIMYLLNELSEEQFKVDLQRKDKLKNKYSDIRDIYRMFIDTCGDLLRQWMIDKSKEDEILKTAKELSVYTNRVFANIRSRYTCQVPRHIFLA